MKSLGEPFDVRVYPDATRDPLTETFFGPFRKTWSSSRLLTEMTLVLRGPVSRVVRAYGLWC